MMNVLTYKGYKARIEFDPRDNLFVGRILGIEDGISFHGMTVAALKESFAAAINHYLADCKAMGRKGARQGCPFDAKITNRHKGTAQKYLQFLP